HSFWVYMPCGLVRIARSEMDAWVAGIDHQTDRPTIRFTLLDSSDGLRLRPQGGLYRPSVAKSVDGKLRFVSLAGVSVIAPPHVASNSLPPPVHIEQVIADRQIYDAQAIADGHMPLPARTRDLQIDYTALSLGAPEKMRFRYKLEGHDAEWEDAGTRRQ